MNREIFITSGKMSLLLGKRKRRKDIGYEGNNPNLLPSGEHLEDRQILFRQHFEARFNPLERFSHPIIKGESTNSPTTDLSSESNWEGLSDGEKVETYVVQTGGKNAPISDMPHEEFKSFMVLRFGFSRVTV